MKSGFLKLAAAAALVCAPSMYAAVTQELTLSDGLGDSITVAQDGTFTTTGSATIGVSNISVDTVGQIDITSNKVTVMVGTFKINSASAFGLADSIPPQLQDEESLDTTSTGKGTLTITYTDTTYSNLSAGLILSGSESTSNTPATKVTFTATGANGAVIPATGAIGSIGPLTGTSSNATGTFLNSFTGASASLTSASTITFMGAGTFNTTFDIAEVPEPGSIVLLGTVLLGVTALLRKKSKAASRS